MDNKITVCPKHDEYVVPLISTMAFRGAEWWCPHCGYTTGIWGSFQELTATPDLIRRHTLFDVMSSEFLHAKGVQSCSRTTWQDEMIKPDELPAEEKARLAKIRDEWKYRIKVEDLKQPFKFESWGAK